MKADETTEDGLAEMEELLRRAEVGRLALSDGDKPYVVPVNFAYENRKIIFHCALKGRKLDILRSNPSCCFEVDEFMGEVSYHYDALCHLDYDSVLAFGRARIESDEGEKLHFFELLHKKYKEFYRKPLSEGGRQFTRIVFDTHQMSTEGNKWRGLTIYEDPTEEQLNNLVIHYHPEITFHFVQLSSASGFIPQFVKMKK